MCYVTQILSYKILHIFLLTSILKLMFIICFIFSNNLPPTTDVRVCTGDSITLQCRVMFSGVAAPSSWRRDGTPIDDNNTLSNHFIVPSTQLGEGLSDLIITNVNPTNTNTEYSCVFPTLAHDSVTLHVAGMYVCLCTFYVAIK